MGKLSNGDTQAPILCELWDYKKSGAHKHLGSFKFSARKIYLKLVFSYYIILLLLKKNHL